MDAKIEAIKRATAIHEAAHAVVAVELRVLVYSIEIYPQNMGLPRDEGSKKRYLGVVKVDAKTSTPCYRAIYSRAGLIAELKIDPGDFALRHVRKDGTNFRKADRDCDIHSPLLHRQKAKEIIERRKNDITALANAVITNIKLETDEIQEILRSLSHG
jgi:hypothetical protein